MSKINLKIQKENEVFGQHSIKRIKGKHSYVSKLSFFISNIVGTYEVCVSLVDSSIMNPIQLQLRFDVETYGGKDLSNVLKNDDLDPVNKLVKKVNMAVIIFIK